MSTLRDRIESWLGRFGYWLYDHPWLALLAIVVLTAAAISQVPSIRMDVSNESFFRKADRTLAQYEAFKDQFGREEYMILGITPPNVFDTAFLTKLKEFHDTLEKELPYVADITSLANVRDTRGEKDQLIVEDLLERIPATEAELAAFRDRVLNSQLYPNYLISPDGKFTVIIVETLAHSQKGQGGDVMAGFNVSAAATAPADTTAATPQAKREPLTPEENQEVVAAAEAVAARFNGPDFPVFVSGGPVLDVYFDAAMSRDMGMFSLLAIAFIGVLLLLLFRRVTGVVLPLLVVVLSLLGTIGLMAATDVPFTLPTNILPSFLLAVSVGCAVHLLAVFYRRFQRDGDKRESIAYALGHSGLPIAMTSLTTAAGLLSFSTSEMAPIGHLGLFGGAGVLIALVYTVVMVPALLAVLPLRQGAKIATTGGGGRMDAFLVGVADLSTGRPWTIVLLSLVLVGASLVGIFSLRFEMDFKGWIPTSETVRQNLDRLDEELGGSASLELVVKGPSPNALYDPALMQGIQRLADYAVDYRHPELGQIVAKTSSVVDVVKETNRALNENRSEAYRLPDNRELIAQELLLFEGSGSDDLEKMVDTQFSLARLSLRTPWQDATTTVNFVSDMETQARALQSNGADVVITGSVNLWTQLTHHMMRSMARSYLIAAGVITLMMMLLISSVRIGAITMAVNFAPIFVTMGLVMGFFDIPLDAFTLTIGSIALGLAVDDTIHFFHNFRRYYGQSGDVRQAVRDTLLTAGRAMLFTSIVLVLGFWLFMFATLNNVFYFGLLTGLALIFALLSDFLLAPAIMTLVTRSAYGRSVAQRWGARQPAAA